MAQDLKLTPQQTQWFNNALVSNRHFRVSADLLDRNRNYVGKIENAEDGALSGQVDLDCTAQVANTGTASTGSIWSASVNAFDPDNHLRLDSQALFLDRLLRITWSLFVPEMLGSARAPDGFVDVILFCGPNNAPVVDGPRITLEAQGMELWARNAIRKARTWKKGAVVTNIIRDIWLNEIGEPGAWINVPDLPDTLPDDFTARLNTTWWDALQYLAESIDCDAFYARDSVGHLRPRPGTVSFVLHDGPNGSVINVPQISTLLGGSDSQGNDVSSVNNRFVVIGQGKPQKGGGKPPAIIGFWNVPAGNRFSAQNMGHPGTPLWQKNTYTNTQIHLKATADRIARNRGLRSLQMAEQVAAETVIVPHLDPFDRYKLQTDPATGYFEFLQSSLPLQWSPDSPQTWGFNREVSTQPRRRRR